MKNLMYKAILRPEDVGYTVFVPSLPGCITYGSDVNEAISMAREAIELYLEDLQDEEIQDDRGSLECSIDVAI